jgi:NTE family protein
MMKRLVERGERFDLVAGASSGSICGAVVVAGLATDGPAMFRSMASTPVVSSRYLRSEKSPFGMSLVVREALARFVPEKTITDSDIELLVSTTRARRLVESAWSSLRAATLGRRSEPGQPASSQAARSLFAAPSPVRALAVAAEALVVHSNRGRSDMHDVIVASCTIPGLYARLPVLDGEVHIDGGAADNTLLQALLERGATDITVVTPYMHGAVSATMFERERPPSVPAHVRLRLISPVRPIRLGRFDFDRDRLEEALEMPAIERVFEPSGAQPDAAAAAAHARPGRAGTA